MGSVTTTSRPEFLDLYGRWRECTDCRLCSNRRRVYEGVGNPEASVMFLLDRQSPEEADAMRFFIDTPYEVVIQTLGEVTGRDMSQYWYTPVVACPTIGPPKFGERAAESTPPPKNREVAACSARVLSEIQLIEPEIVVACGTQAVRSLFPTDTPSLSYYAGEMREAQLKGTYGTYAMPVMLAPSLHALYTQQDMGPGQLWEKTFRQIGLALDIADALRRGV